MRRRIPRAATALASAAVVALALASACRPKPQRPGALCSFDVASDDELAGKTLPTSTWLTLVSPSIDRQTLVRQGPWRDSCGIELTPTDYAACPAGAALGTPIAGDRVEGTDLVMAQISGDRMLAWAATDEFSDGMARGTVALVKWHDDGIDVVGTGLVTGLRQGARARLHHASGVEVLVLESDRCDASRRCIRVGQFVPLAGGRFREAELHEPGRGCVGRPQFDLERSTEVRIDGRIVRSFRLTRNIELDGTGIVVTDLVVVEDRDAGDPAAAPTPFRRATARRPLVFVDGHFELRDEDLWERVLRDYGAVREPAGPATPPTDRRAPRR